MESYAIVIVPHGITYDGRIWLRSLRIRELDGYDELHLAD